MHFIYFESHVRATIEKHNRIEFCPFRISESKELGKVEGSWRGSCPQLNERALQGSQTITRALLGETEENNILLNDFTSKRKQKKGLVTEPGWWCSWPVDKRQMLFRFRCFLNRRFFRWRHLLADIVTFVVKRRRCGLQGDVLIVGLLLRGSQPWSRDRWGATFFLGHCSVIIT